MHTPRPELHQQPKCKEGKGHSSSCGVMVCWHILTHQYNAERIWPSCNTERLRFGQVTWHSLHLLSLPFSSFTDKHTRTWNTAFSTEIFKFSNGHKWFLKTLLGLLRFLIKEIKFIFQSDKYEWWLLMLEREKLNKRGGLCCFPVFSFVMESNFWSSGVWRLPLKCKVSIHEGKSLMAFKIVASEVYHVLKGWRVRWRPESCQENFLSCINIFC